MSETPYLVHRTTSGRLNILESLPSFVRRVLVVGPEHPGLLEALRGGGQLEVLHQSLEDLLDGVRPAERQDALLALQSPPQGSEAAWYAAVEHILAPWGCLQVLLLPETPRGASLSDRVVALAAIGAQYGWIKYAEHGGEGAGEQTRILLSFMRREYAPLEHAALLLEKGHADWAFDVLERIPDAFLTDAEKFVHVQSERLLCLLQWAKSSADPASLEFASRAQMIFERIVAAAPACHAAYQCRAEFWRLTGHPEMAARLLRTVEHVAPNASVKRQLQVLGGERTRVRDLPAPPEWRPPPTLPRILMLMHPRPHYGLDVLYDGLCRVLGAGQVIEFPSKSWLHGALPPEMANYPCSFHHPGHTLNEADILERLREGWFDWVVYGDVESALDRSFAMHVAELAGNRPFVLLDQVDEFVDTRSRVREYTGRSHFTAYFKRELLENIDLGPGAFPLPFSYPDDRALDDPGGERSHPFFWAGHRLSGTRRLYLECLEELLGEDLARTFPPEAYQQRLRNSEIGLNLFGFGFDTVRYWELPANGCLLFSEQLPIQVPHPFRDGDTAVFFQDPADMELKLKRLLADLPAAREIAARGHAHFKQHHSSSARARQFLGWIQQQS